MLFIFLADLYSNGTCHDSPEEEGREPSYVRLARCLSGYSTLNYDPSKQVLGRSPSPMRPSQEIVETPTTPTPTVEAVTTSFIEQRIERLYGPGALAQVFYSRSPSTRISKTPKPDPTQPKLEVDPSKSVPVMRLLRPEFRAQLAASSSSPSITPKRSFNNKINNDSVDACNPVKRHLFPSPCENVKDGHYFLKKLDEEIKGLERVACSCEAELETCKSESGCGILRAVAGKARLLVAEKLNQFRGLCQKNINQSKTENFPTTNEDLAGFWDMVMIQVSDVHTQFLKLDTLRKNNWCEESVQENSEKVKPVTRPVTVKNKTNVATTKSVSEASKARDAARRKMLQERRQAMKQQMAPNPSATAQQPTTSLFIV